MDEKDQTIEEDRKLGTTLAIHTYAIRSYDIRTVSEGKHIYSYTRNTTTCIVSIRKNYVYNKIKWKLEGIVVLVKQDFDKIRVFVMILGIEGLKKEFYR